MDDAAAPADTVAVVLAGGKGTRLFELTELECKPALPFARFHRVVDFTMAALVRSRVGTAIIATQYKPATLSAHLERYWSPFFPHGGLRIVDGSDAVPGGGYDGTADVLRANAHRLDGAGARDVLVVSADHVYDMDYRTFIAAHRAGGAAITIAGMPVPKSEASRFGVIEEGDSGRIAGFTEKPASPATLADDPAQALASLGIYVIDWPWLRSVLTDPGMIDFGEDVIPMAVLRGDAAVWRWRGYWRDVGTLDGLRESWLDFDGPAAPCRRPFPPGGFRPAPVHMLADGKGLAHAALGGIRRLSPLRGGSLANRNMALDRSVVMPGAFLGAGSRLRNVIVGSGVVVPDDLVIGEDPETDARWFRIAGDTTLVTRAMMARRAERTAAARPLFGTGLGRRFGRDTMGMT